MRFGSQDVAFQLWDKLDCVPVPHAFIILAFGGGGEGGLVLLQDPSISLRNTRKHRLPQGIGVQCVPYRSNGKFPQPLVPLKNIRCPLHSAHSREWDPLGKAALSR